MSSPKTWGTIRILCTCCLLNSFSVTAQDAVIVGSSFITNLAEYSQSLLLQAGLSAQNKKCQIIGAPVSYIWSHCAETSPVKACEELPKGTHEILYLNAQRPWEQTEREIAGCDSFALLGMSNPSQRIFISEYWVEELAPDCFNDECIAEESIAMYRRGALKVAYEVARTVGLPVYIVPNGTVIERTKQMAAGGDLEGFTTRMAPMASDGKHLSNLGHYVQALTFAAAGWQQDVRGWSDAIINQWDNVVFDLSRNDANALQDMIYKVVTTTPFSGYCATDPVDFDDYLTALQDSMRTWEGFDNMVQSTKGSGSFTGDNGITWNYTNATKKTNWYYMTDDHVELFTGSTLSTTLSDGLKHISFAGRVGSGGSAQVRVMINGTEHSTHTVNSNKPSFHYTARDIDLFGAVEVGLEITVTSGNNLMLDNLFWLEHSGTTPAREAVRPAATQAPKNVSNQQRFDLAGRRVISGRPHSAGVKLVQVRATSGSSTKTHCVFEAYSNAAIQ